MSKDNEPGHRVAYVFDSQVDKQELQQFNDFITDGFDPLAEDEQPGADLQVIYVFKAHDDRYELEAFQSGPKYIQAVETFGRWLRAQHKYQSDSLTDEERTLLGRIWANWCTTLSECGAVSE